jgi:chromosome segregation ATPase
MGIQVYWLAKRFRKNKKDIHCQDNTVQTNNDTIHHQQLVDLNKRLSDMYHKLTQQQDTFENKKQENINIHEVLKNKKVEVGNRLLNLERIRNEFGDKFKDRTTSIQEFKELCSMFVSTHDDIEKVQMEIHESEIELEIYLQSWNEEVKKHNDEISHLRQEIEIILNDIARLNECEIHNI